MHKLKLISLVESFKKQMADKLSTTSFSLHLEAMMGHLQEFIASKEIQDKHDYGDIYDYEFINFLQQLERMKIWQESFQDQQATATEIFWHSPLADIANKFTRLLLMGINQQELTKALKDLLRSYKSGLQDDLGVLITTLKNINHYRKRLHALKAADLACLSYSSNSTAIAFNEHHIHANTVNAFGEYPIHLAALSNMRLQVAQVLALGCDINQATRTGQAFSDNKAATALHYAARYNQRDMVLFLLNNQADASKTDIDGKLAIDWAREASANEVVQLLETYSATQANNITIYIDLGIHSERFGPSSVQELEKYGNKLMLKEELRDESCINLHHIARRITCASAHSRMQVGESPEDAKKILGQHSYYKHAAVYYTVKLQVNLQDLEGPYSEREMSDPRIINVGDDKHWVLKPNTQIKAEHIQSITLWDDRWPSLPKVKEYVNPGAIQANIHLPRSADTLRTELSEFLNDEEFWGRRVYRFRYYAELPPFPAAIIQMQQLCNSPQHFYLEELQKIAAANCPNEYKGVTGFAYSFFSADNITKSFYRAIMQASNLYDVLLWINQHKPILTEEVLHSLKGQ